jgi:hypothetical protein
MKTTTVALRRAKDSGMSSSLEKKRAGILAHPVVMRLIVIAMKKGAIGVIDDTQSKMDPMPSSSLTLGFVSLSALEWA